MKRLPHYSQHFLRNPHFVRELVERSKLKKTDTVYDIGAGSGVITSALARYCRHVIAVEPEPNTAALLRKNMQRYSNVRVEEVDFMSMRLPNSPYSVFANIPFHLSSPIVRKLTEAANPPRVCCLIVQKQFANKLLPDHPGFTSQLGMMIGPEFAVRIRRPLKRTDFWPHPHVDTVLLEITPRDNPLLPYEQIADFREFTKKCFTNPKFFSSVKTSHTSPSAMQLDTWVQFYSAIRTDPRPL